MKKTGTIESVNVSPKGFREGFLLRTSRGIVQINLPQHRAEGSADDFKPGEPITVEVEEENPHGEPAHPVFRLVDDDTFAGRIERLNYALHGEVNGGILDSGDFLHLKPEGARAVGIAIGMEVEGRGVRKPMEGGHSVIEAEEVNGIPIHRHQAGKKHKAEKHTAKHARSH